MSESVLHMPIGHESKWRAQQIVPCTTILIFLSDFQFEDLNQGRSLPKTSTLAEEDSQEIPSSSCSIKFGTKKKLKHMKSLKGNF